MIKISVIVAAYNVEKYIERCLKSLIYQSLRNVEIIVVNDASTDQTFEIISKYAVDDDRIHVINKQVNEGLSLARNSGLEQAKGKYVAFVDGDDFVEEDTYKESCELADKMNADCVVFASVYDRKDGNTIEMPLNATKVVYEPTDNKLYFAEVLGTLPNETSDYAVGFTPWGRIYRRDILTANNIRFISERELIYEDLMFALNVNSYLRKVCLINKPFYHYCENEGSLTKKASLERYHKVGKMYGFIKSEPKYRQIFEDEDLLIRFQRTIFTYIRLCIMQLPHNDSGKAALKEIVNAEMTREVVGDYPVTKLPLKKSVFAFLVKYKCRMLLWRLVKIYKI